MGCRQRRRGEYTAAEAARLLGITRTEFLVLVQKLVGPAEVTSALTVKPAEVFALQVLHGSMHRLRTENMPS